MSRKEFMERLRSSVEYFESERRRPFNTIMIILMTPRENEAKVIEELVSPEQVAQKIKAGLSDAASEFSEEDTGYPV